LLQQLLDGWNSLSAKMQTEAPVDTFAIQNEGQGQRRMLQVLETWPNWLIAR